MKLPSEQQLSLGFAYSSAILAAVEITVALWFGIASFFKSEPRR